MLLRTIKTFLNSVEIERIKLCCFQVLGPGVQVSISEINCPEPDCPPIKTAILLFRDGQPTQSIIVHKPAKDVQIADLQEALSPSSRQSA